MGPGSSMATDMTGCIFQIFGTSNLYARFPYNSYVLDEEAMEDA